MPSTSEVRGRGGQPGRCAESGEHMAGQQAGERAKKAVAKGKADQRSAYEREFIRAENEDDDGYDPYSDRRPEPEPLFERDPWG